MNKFKFSAVVEFEIDENEAAHLLSDPDPKRAVNAYLASRHNAAATGFSDYICDHPRCELQKALGAHLAERKIAEQKQLPVSTGGES